MIKQEGDHWHDFTDSEIIAGAGVERGHLVVEFKVKNKPNTRYLYSCKEALCCTMALAESKGKWFVANVKYNFGYTRLA